MSDVLSTIVWFCFIFLFVCPDTVTDWIHAWRGTARAPAPSETVYPEDDHETGYNEAAGWLLFGHGIDTVTVNLINPHTSADNDEGVWNAIRDWEKLTAKPKETADENAKT